MIFNISIDHDAPVRACHFQSKNPMARIILLLTMLFHGHAYAAPNFQGIETYIKNLTAERNQPYVCYISSAHGMEISCPDGFQQLSKNESIYPYVIGAITFKSDWTGFIFVLKENKDGTYSEEFRTASIDMPSLWMEFDATAKSGMIEIRFATGRMGMPTTHDVVLKKINGAWVVATVTRDVLARCNDDSVGLGSVYSADFVNKLVTLKRFDKNCSAPMVSRRRVDLPVYSARALDPLAEKYIPKWATK